MPPNLDAISWILPGHRIQTEPLVVVSGAAGSTLELLVPPAGWPIVMVEPEPALRCCLTQAGMTVEHADAAAVEETVRLRRNLPLDQQPILMGEDEKWRHGVPTAAVVDVLTRIGPRERAIGAALMAGAVKASRARMIGPELDIGVGPYSVNDFTSGPAPEAWTEAWFEFGSAVACKADPEVAPGLATTNPGMDFDNRNRDEFLPLELTWLTQTIAVASEIARVTGQQVFDPPGWWDGNSYSYHGDVHRWLLLDFACYAMPETTFVKRLIQASQARDVTDLRVALQAPHSYRREFELLDAFETQLRVSGPSHVDWIAFTGDRPFGRGK